MPLNEHSVIHLPPLSHPPRWASAPPPKAEWLIATQVEVVQLSEDLRKIQELIYLQPAPPSSALRKLDHPSTESLTIRESLRRLRYPPTLTIWVDRARTLADSMVNAIDTLNVRLRMLKMNIPQTSEWHHALRSARQATDNAVRYCDELDDHLDTLIREQESDDHISQTGMVLHFAR